MARGVGKPPSGNDVWSQVSRSDKARISAYNRNPLMQGGGINKFDYADAADATGIASPFSAIPTAASKGQFTPPSVYDVVGVFGYDLDDVNAPSMEYYSFDERGYQYNNESEMAAPSTAPAPITIVPTSTTNPDRPRTVAAGYDVAERKCTVIFRDGTYYNYFDISNAEWQNFKRARSKGRFILTYWEDFKPRGVADVSTIPEFARSVVYRFLRTGQDFRGGYQENQRIGSKRGSGYKPGNLGGTGRKRLSKSRGQTGGSGVSKP